jgi:hypothetical protein
MYHGFMVFAWIKNHKNKRESIVSMKRSVSSKLCCNKFVLEADIESSLGTKPNFSGTGCAIFFYYLES